MDDRRRWLYRIVIERRSILTHGARQGIYAYMQPVIIAASMPVLLVPPGNDQLALPYGQAPGFIPAPRTATIILHHDRTVTEGNPLKRVAHNAAIGWPSGNIIAGDNLPARNENAQATWPAIPPAQDVNAGHHGRSGPNRTFYAGLRSIPGLNPATRSICAVRSRCLMKRKRQHCASAKKNGDASAQMTVKPKP